MENKSNFILEVKHRILKKPNAYNSSAWLFVNVVHEKNGTNYTNRIRLQYKCFSDYRASDLGHGEFVAHYSNGVVSLTGGGLFLDVDDNWKGQRIGTYLMNKIIEWAKQWPDARVVTIRLLDGQATPDNKERRNRFYQRFGIEFDFSDDQGISGSSRPMRVSDLKLVTSWKENITEIDTLAYIKEQKISLANLQSNYENSQRQLKTLYEAQRHPFKWFFNEIKPQLCIVGAVVFIFGLLILSR